MDSKIEPIVLDSLNYAIWATDMEMSLKIKGLWHYMRVSILDLSDDQEKFVIDKNKNEFVGIITTYISREI